MADNSYIIPYTPVSRTTCAVAPARNPSNNKFYIVSANHAGEKPGNSLHYHFGSDQTHFSLHLICYLSSLDTRSLGDKKKKAGRESCLSFAIACPHTGLHRARFFVVPSENSWLQRVLRKTLAAMGKNANVRGF